MTMTVKTRKKLIEVALPLDAINKACKDDKDRKTGHIRNLHKWYAPMPLPAWRAALFGSVVDDPANDLPEDAATGRRAELFNMLEQILPLDAAKSPALFHPIRDLLRSQPTEPVTVMDPFCGGGSTLLEAQRLGFRTIGSDLNPIPVLITTVLTRYPSLFSDVAPVNPCADLKIGEPRGMPLVDDVRYYAAEIAKRARGELEQYFPELEIPGIGERQRATIISWIWSRTLKCENPACGVVTPLASSFELTRGASAHWIEPSVIGSGANRHVEFSIQGGSGKPPKAPKLGRGAKFECVACKSLIDEKQVRAAAQTVGLGLMLMACVAKTRDGKRLYLAPTQDVLATVKSPKPDWVPELELSTHPQYMGAPRYGMRTVADLFTSRQLKVLEVFAKNVRDIWREIQKDAIPSLGEERASPYATAITTILALCVSKLSQSHNILVRWKLDSRNGSGKPLPAFDTQTVPIVWDFAENNPFGESVGDWSETVVPTALRAFQYCVPDAAPAEVLQLDARSAAEILSGPILLATDPPYYDSVPYADLSDVFYPLLRFMLQERHESLFETVRSPRATELVADSYRLGSRDKAREYFLEGFRDVFKRIKPRLREDTPISVVYSFRQHETLEDGEISSTGWEVMLRALIEAGFTITATWPIRTTLENRSRDIDSNALASAILIVCRPRIHSAGKTTRRQLLTELQAELPLAIRRLQASSIAPVDLQQAMIGPGISVFSRYEAVLDAEGAEVSVHEALAMINQTLDELLARQEGDFDSDTRWALAWFGDHGFEDGPFGDAHTYFLRFNTAENGLVRAGIIKSGRGDVRLLRADELSQTWDPVDDSRLTIWEIVHQLIRVLESQGEPAAAGFFRKLGSKAEVARELAYRLYALSERKKRATEALSYNALVQSWPEIARLAREGAKPREEQSAMF